MNLNQELDLRAQILVDLEMMSQGWTQPLSRQQLLDYSINGIRLPLIDYTRGIRNPRDFAATLAVVSSSNGPYPDREVFAGMWEYRFADGSAVSDNKKLIAASELQVPLILFQKPRPGVYFPIPVYVSQVDLDRRLVLLSHREVRSINPQTASEVERRWAESIVERRVHQPAFRAMILRAYDTQCTICHFRHAELLDAAHILSDKHERGYATTTNGMSMCKIHHAAYDQKFLGVDPDYTIHINNDLLHEVDGPMLKYGLQQMDRQKIILPSRRVDHPDRENLELRFREFQMAQ